MSADPAAFRFVSTNRRVREDRRFVEDIAAVKGMIAAGAFTRFIASILPSRSG